jgi:hypothetical protein
MKCVIMLAYFSCELLNKHGLVIAWIFLCDMGHNWKYFINSFQSRFNKLITFPTAMFLKYSLNVALIIMLL